MNEALLLRVGGVAAIAGSLLTIVFNAMHPRGADPADMDALLRLFAASDIWRIDHLGLLLGVFLLLGGWVALNQSLASEGGSAATWARLGFVTVVVGTAEFLVLIAIDGLGAQEVARAYTRATGAEAAAALAAARVMENVTLPLFNVFVLVYWTADLLFGLALAQSSGYPHWLGWLFALFGAATVILVGLPFAFAGPNQLILNVLFPALSIPTTVLVLVLGFYLYRKGGELAS